MRKVKKLLAFVLAASMLVTTPIVTNDTAKAAAVDVNTAGTQRANADYKYQATSVPVLEDQTNGTKQELFSVPAIYYKYRMGTTGISLEDGYKAPPAWSYGGDDGTANGWWRKHQFFNQAIWDTYYGSGAGKMAHPLLMGAADSLSWNGDGQGHRPWAWHQTSATPYNSNITKDEVYFYMNHNLHDGKGGSGQEGTGPGAGSAHPWSSPIKGIVAPMLSTDGKLLATEGNSYMPYFYDDFLGTTGDDFVKVGDWATRYGTLENPAGFALRKATTGDDAGYWVFDSSTGTDQIQVNSSTGEVTYNSSFADVYNATDSSGYGDMPGFFPFNYEGKNAGNGGNGIVYGFGTRMDIPFTIPSGAQKDGKDVVFDFSGDDDLWVYIDGELVLDIGGAHTKAFGNINFKNKTAYVDDAFQVNYNGNNSSLTGLGGSTTNIKDYDDGKEHTLTIFYMERGYYDSNLRIRMNFEIIDVNQQNKFKVTNNVGVSAISNDFQTAAKNAAEKTDFYFNVVNKTNNDADHKIMNDGDTATQTGSGTIVEKDSNAKTAEDLAKTIRDNNILAAQMVNPMFNTSFEIVGGGDTIKSRTAVDTTPGSGHWWDAGTSTWVKAYDDYYNGPDGRSGDADTLVLVNNKTIVQPTDYDTAVSTEVDFYNELKPTDFSITKAYPDAEDPNADYTFRVSYTKLADVSNATAGNNGSMNGFKYKVNGQTRTVTNNTITIKAGQTAVFEDVPVASTFVVEEVIPSGATYKLDSASVNSGGGYIETNGGGAVNPVTVTTTSDGSVATILTMTNADKDIANVDLVYYAQVGRTTNLPLDWHEDASKDDYGVVYNAGQDAISGDMPSKPEEQEIIPPGDITDTKSGDDKTIGFGQTTFDITSDYQYKGEYNNGSISSDYRYLVIKYTGNITGVRIEGRATGGTKVIRFVGDTANNDVKVQDVLGNDIVDSATQKTAVIDLSQYNLTGALFTSGHLHEGGEPGTGATSGSVTFNEIYLKKNFDVPQPTYGLKTSYGPTYPTNNTYSNISVTGASIDATHVWGLHVADSNVTINSIYGGDTPLSNVKATIRYATDSSTPINFNLNGSTQQLSMDGTGGWDTYVDYEVTGLSLNANTNNTLVLSSGNGHGINVQSVTFSVVGQPAIPAQGYKIIGTSGANLAITHPAATGKRATAVWTDGVEGTSRNTLTYTAQHVGYDQFTVPLRSGDGGKVNAKVTVFNYDVADRAYVLDYGLKVSLLSGTNAITNMYEGADKAYAWSNGEADPSAASGTSLANSAVGNTYADLYTFFGFEANNTYPRTGAGNYTAPTTGFSKNSLALSQGNLTAAYGTGDVLSTAAFAPTKFMSTVDNGYYALQVKKAGTTTVTDAKNGTPVMEGNVKVLPATVVYYEDNFASSGNSANGTNGIFYTSGNTNVSTGGTFDTQSADDEEQYGHDAVYFDADTTSSNNTLSSLAEGGKAAFKFHGTGFEIISRATQSTGSIGVTIYKAGSGQAALVNNNGTVRIQGGLTNIEKAFTVNTYAENTNLYQIPAVSWKNTTGNAADYIVVLQAIKRTDKKSNNDATVYVDGVRIYNPIGGNDSDYEEAKDEYNKIGEDVNEIYDIKSLILGPSFQYNAADPTESTNIGVGAQVTLVKFAEGDNGMVKLLAGSTIVESYYNGTSKTSEVGQTAAGDDVAAGLLEYAVSGPNKELYLSDEYGIAFNASSASEVKALQIGVKTSGNTTGASIEQWTGTNWVKVSDVTSAAESYIKVTPNQSGVVYLRAKGVSSAAKQYISITNIKNNNYTLTPVTNLDTFTKKETTNASLSITAGVDKNKKGYANSYKTFLPAGSSQQIDDTAVPVSYCTFSFTTTQDVVFVDVSTATAGRIKVAGKSYRNTTNGKVWTIKFKVLDQNGVADSDVNIRLYDSEGNTNVTPYTAASKVQ